MSLKYRIFTPTLVVALQKITQAFTGLGTALMVSHFLSPEEQGYFYTMGSLLSSYIIFDLGLSSYLLQRSAQLSTGLTINRFDKITPNGEQCDQFLAFTHWVFKWYRNAGIVALLILLPIGLWTLGQNADDLLHSPWFWPWILIVGVIALHMPTIGFMAILEGTGAIRETYTLKIIHYAIGALLAWGFITNGRGLYAQAFPMLATALVCYGWFFYKYTKTLNWHVPHQQDITQLTLPHIKHTASNWLFNYTFINTPVILSFVSGNIIFSGQLGLSITIANVGGAIAMSAVTSKLPGIIRQIEENKAEQALSTYISAIKSYGILYFVGSAVLILIIYLLNDFDISSRLLGPLDMSLLLFAFAGYHIATACTGFIRANGSNELTAPTVILTLLAIPLSLAMHHFGSTGILISLCWISLPLVLNAIYVIKKLPSNPS